MAVVDRDASGLSGPLPAAGDAQRSGAAGTDLPADRRGHRRGHHLTAGGDRGQRELGLPVRLARDGSFTLKALWVAACPDEGQRFFDWIAASTGPLDGERQVPVMFGAGGERDLTEHRLDHLAGYAGSQPARVGNDAWTQKQLDVWS